MRGIVSAGMGVALETLGLLRAFDTVYGSSAGAMNAAYFVTGHAAYGMTIYYQDINNRRFIDPRRALIGRPIVALDYLFETIIGQRKVLNMAAVLSAAPPLKVVVSSLSRRQAVCLGAFDSDADLVEALRASSSIPFLGGPPRTVKGELWSDASLYEPIPYRSAEADGCTHVLVIKTRPRGIERAQASFFERHVIAKSLGKIHPALRDDYLSRRGRYTEDLRYVRAKTDQPGSFGPFVYALELPQGSSVVGTLERRRAVLVKSAAVSLDLATRTLTGQDCSVVEVLKPFTTKGQAIVDAHDATRSAFS